MDERLREALDRQLSKVDWKHTCQVLPRKRMEVFEIGLARTGTRSVCRAFQILGLNVRHGFPECHGCRLDAVSRFSAGDSNFHLYRTCEYSGNIAMCHWKELAETRPEAKFVLTKRPLSGWLRSHKKKYRSQHKIYEQAFAKRLNLTVATRIKLYGQVLWDWDVWKEGYLRHVAAVTNYFEGSDRLLVVNVFRDNKYRLWKRLAAFIRTGPPVGVPFPYLKTRDRVV